MTGLRSKLQACHSGEGERVAELLPVCAFIWPTHSPTETPSVDLAALLPGADRQEPRAFWLALVAWWTECPLLAHFLSSIEGLSTSSTFGKGLSFFINPREVCHSFIIWLYCSNTYHIQNIVLTVGPTMVTKTKPGSCLHWASSRIKERDIHQKTMQITIKPQLPREGKYFESLQGRESI